MPIWHHSTGEAANKACAMSSTPALEDVIVGAAKWVLRCCKVVTGASDSLCPLASQALPLSLEDVNAAARCGAMAFEWVSALPARSPQPDIAGTVLVLLASIVERVALDARRRSPWRAGPATNVTLGGPTRRMSASESGTCAQALQSLFRAVVPCAVAAWGGDSTGDKGPPSRAACCVHLCALHGTASERSVVDLVQAAVSLSTRIHGARDQGGGVASDGTFPCPAVIAPVLRACQAVFACYLQSNGVVGAAGAASADGERGKVWSLHHKLAGSAYGLLVRVLTERCTTTPLLSNDPAAIQASCVASGADRCSRCSAEEGGTPYDRDTKLSASRIVLASGLVRLAAVARVKFTVMNLVWRTLGQCLLATAKAPHTQRVAHSDPCPSPCLVQGPHCQCAMRACVAEASRQCCRHIRLALLQLLPGSTAAVVAQPGDVVDLSLCQCAVPCTSPTTTAQKCRPSYVQRCAASAMGTSLKTVAHTAQHGGGAGHGAMAHDGDATKAHERVGRIVKPLRFFAMYLSTFLRTAPGWVGSQASVVQDIAACTVEVASLAFCDVSLCNTNTAPATVAAQDCRNVQLVQRHLREHVLATLMAAMRRFLGGSRAVASGTPTNLSSVATSVQAAMVGELLQRLPVAPDSGDHTAVAVHLDAIGRLHATVAVLQRYAELHPDVLTHVLAGMPTLELMVRCAHPAVRLGKDATIAGTAASSGGGGGAAPASACLASPAAVEDALFNVFVGIASPRPVDAPSAVLLRAPATMVRWLTACLGAGKRGCVQARASTTWPTVLLWLSQIATRCDCLQRVCSQEWLVSRTRPSSHTCWRWRSR